MTFDEWWEENRNLELKGYPRKEAAQRAWNSQEAKFKEQAQRIEELEKDLNNALSHIENITGVDRSELTY